MTVPDSSPSRRGPLVAIIVLVAVVAGAAGLWYLFFRPAGPAPVSLGTTPPIAAATASAEAGSASSAVDPSAGPSEAASPDDGTTSGIAGTWNVDPTVGSFSDFSSSFVGYRVQEELASVGATEAVGRTPDVTGTMSVDGTTITAAEFTADLTTLQSDEGNRDRQLRRQGLETGTFPTATFTLTQPIELGSEPAEGSTVDATAVGDMTIHGTTKSVEIPVQAKVDNGVVTVVGSLPVLFSDFGMEKPQAMIVLSVDDKGTMEFQLQFTRA
jgi:polyisoprenoid-binding protein YceI